MLRWLLTALALTLGAQLAAQDKRIALTFDDTPRHAGVLYSEDERAIRIIAALSEAEVEQAAFFLNPGKLAERPGGEARIAAYVAAGHVIANHTSNHSQLRDTDASDYIADIDAAAKWLDVRKGARAWFRFPYLDEGGRDKAKRDAIRAALAERGLINGYVTVDASDWFYDGALSTATRAGKPVDLEALKALFIESHIEAVRYYDALAQRALGRSPAHVLLLHESDLVALALPDLVAALRADGWTIITADDAYADALTDERPDVPFSQGTITEMIAWERGLPAPRWYARNDTKLAQAEFDARAIGKASSAIPARYLGVWDYEGGTCAPESDLRMAIRPRAITFYESVGKATDVRLDGEDVIVDLAMDGEGETWEQSLRLSLVGNGNEQRLHTSDASEPKTKDDLPRKRCQ
ncbi:polysaccharide deacetylase family protein [uncultured Erythrobacter sp.]|uniref:polysaccharide deacetylase family protein n=1 Tax=uncultured Erythrobacter sp. TaxID=263913 RepID=UPI002606D276|nr:polysaccharide deacetylase family protein [uncultured Erythrobacter sp.]